MILYLKILYFKISIFQIVLMILDDEITKTKVVYLDEIHYNFIKVLYQVHILRFKNNFLEFYRIIYYFVMFRKYIYAQNQL